MDFGTRMKRYFRATKLFLYYCSPCVLSLALVIVANFRRVSDVDKVVVRQVCQQLNPPNASSGAPPRDTPVQMQKLIQVVTSNGWSDCLQNASVLAGNLSAPQYIHSYFLTAWSANSVVISTLTLLPFGILGLGLALRYFREIPLSEKAKDRVDHEKDHFLSYRKIALRDFFLKYLVGFVIAVGWLYILNPHGQAASAINDLLTNTDIVSNDTAPNFFNFKDSSLKHALTAVFGG
jgi:hypothetical protein